MRKISKNDLSGRPLCKENLFFFWQKSDLKTWDEFKKWRICFIENGKTWVGAAAWLYSPIFHKNCVQITLLSWPYYLKNLQKEGIYHRKFVLKRSKILKKVHFIWKLRSNPQPSYVWENHSTFISIFSEKSRKWEDTHVNLSSKHQKCTKNKMIYFCKFDLKTTT